jgi:hypothetical protein
MGGGVAARTPYDAVLVTGSEPSGAVHVVFALFTIFTCGLAIIPWIIVAASNSKRRVMLSIDLYGNITES